MARIGVLSYSIYLWQTLFLHHRHGPVFGPLAWMTIPPVSWLGFFLMALFSYEVIEQPSLALRGRLRFAFMPRSDNSPVPSSYS